MAAPDIASVDAFLRPETSDYVLMDRTATPGSPLRAEIDAGLRVNPIMTGMEGLVDGTNFVDVQLFNSLRTLSAVGRSPAITGSLMTLFDAAGAGIGAEVSRLDKKTLAVMHNGDTAGQLMDVFDVTIGSISSDHPTDTYVTETTTFAVNGFFPRVTIPS